MDGVKISLLPAFPLNGDATLAEIPASLNGTTYKIPGALLGGATSRFGIEDNTGVQDRSIDLGAFKLQILNGTELYAAIGDFENFTNPVTQLDLKPNEFLLGYSDYSGENPIVTSISTGGGVGGFLQFKIQESGKSSIYTLPNVNSNQYLPLSVNGQFADTNGNIEIGDGGGGGSSQRFGVSGEDDVLGQNRNINLNAFSVAFGNTLGINPTSITSTTDEINLIDSAGASIQMALNIINLSSDELSLRKADGTVYFGRNTDGRIDIITTDSLYIKSGTLEMISIVDNSIQLPNLVNADTDSQAQSSGVPLGSLYLTSTGFIKMRLT